MTATGENAVRVTFESPKAKNDLHLLRLEGTEGLSELFEFDLRLASTSADLKLDELVGSAGLITISSDEGTRHIHGLMCQLEQRECGRKHTVYQATLVPTVWRLTQGADCRIFQKKSLGKILKAVLGKANVPYRYQAKDNKEPPVREYCVQYRESDWDFVCRLMEEEGFFYYFEHDGKRDVLQVTNDSTVAPDMAGQSRLKYHEPGQTTATLEHIYRLYLREGIQPGRVSFTDYNFEKPSVSLRSSKGDGRDAALEVYDYPGHYQEPARGKAVSRIRLQERRAPALVLRGGCDCPRLTSGYAFTLNGHPRKDLNRKKYLITSIHHLAEKKAEDLESGALDQRCGYENSFECMPRTVSFRPPRVTPWPAVQGVQTAVVVGRSGDEIYTDKHGRVKVQFHWDREGKRDQNSSCWVRVSQLWAGQGWGAMFIPRVGQEVIVDFLEGNPDRPIITGRVYHAQNPPPYTLPGAKTRSTIMSNSTIGGGGSNEIRFEDQKDQEEIYTHAQKDQNEVVEHDHTTRVGNDQTHQVGRDRDREVGRDETTVIKRDRTETVGNDETITVQGHRAESVGGNEKVSVGKDRHHTVGKNQVVQVRKDASLSVTGNESEKVLLKKKLTVGSTYTINVGAKRAITVGADFVRTVAGAVKEKVARTQVVNVGRRLEFICGDSRLVMDKSGKIIIEGKNILFRSSGPVTLKGKVMRMVGSTLGVKMSGAIKLKGSKVSEN